MRQLHLVYGADYEAIRRLSISEAEKRARSGDLWFKTDQRRRVLLKQAVRGLRCTALKSNGEHCSRTARPDYIGQMCSSHAPPVSEWPDLAETQRLWADRSRDHP